MSKKLLIAASLLAFSTAGVNATCQSFDGFSAGATVGFNVSTVKVKKDEKKLTETYKTTTKSDFNQTGFDTAMAAVADAWDKLADIQEANPVTIGNGAAKTEANRATMNTQIAARYENLIKAVKKFGIEYTPVTVSAVTHSDPNGGGANTHDKYDFTAAKLGTTAATVDTNKTTDNLRTKAFADWDLDAFQDMENEYNFKNGAFFAELAKLASNYGGTSEQSDAKTLEYKDAETNTKAHKNNVNFGLNVAYGHTFGKFYIGAGILAEMNTGKTTVQSKSDAKSKTYNGLGHTYNLSTEVADVTAKEKLKQKFSFGLRLKPGVTCGDWLFYVPVDLSLTKYEFKSERDEAANVALAAATEAAAKTPATYDAGTVTNSVTTTYKAASDSADATFKKNKTKFGYAFGLGAAVKLADNVSLDLAVTYSPNNKITVNTPNYTKASMLDAAGYGDKKTIKVSNYKATLGVSYHF